MQWKQAGTVYSQWLLKTSPCLSQSTTQYAGPFVQPIEESTTKGIEISRSFLPFTASPWWWLLTTSHSNLWGTAGEGRPLGVLLTSHKLPSRGFSCYILVLPSTATRKYPEHQSGKLTQTDKTQTDRRQPGTARSPGEDVPGVSIRDGWAGHQPNLALRPSWMRTAVIRPWPGTCWSPATDTRPLGHRLKRIAVVKQTLEGRNQVGLGVLRQRIKQWPTAANPSKQSSSLNPTLSLKTSTIIPTNFTHKT